MLFNVIIVCQLINYCYVAKYFHFIGPAYLFQPNILVSVISQFTTFCYNTRLKMADVNTGNALSTFLCYYSVLNVCLLLLLKFLCLFLCKIRNVHRCCALI